MPEPKVIIGKPKHFRIRICECGTDTCHGSHKKVTNENALALAYGVTRTIATDLVGERASATFQYNLACLMLRLINIDKNKLMKDIENAENNIDIWELKK